MLTYILATAVVLGVLIFVHELGHFVTAKMVGIEVERFSIGFGPRILGFRKGETEYVISLLPLGGYVKMLGMEEMEPIEGKSAASADSPGAGLSRTTPAPADAEGVSDPASEGPRRDFESKSAPARALVLSAGVIMNIIFAVLVFGLSAYRWGVPIEPEARIPEGIAAILPEGAAPLANVRAGTRVTAVGKKKVDDLGELRTALLTAPAGEATIHFETGEAATIDLPAIDDVGRMTLIRALEPGRDPVIGQVVDGGPAAAAGIQAGDRVVAIAGSPVRVWPELVEAIQARPGEAVAIEVVRDGQPLTFQVVPRAETVAFPDGTERVVGRIGVGEAPPPPLPREEIGLGAALAHGVQESWDSARMIVKLLGDLVTGKVSARSLGGPILIGQLSGEVAKVGLEPFLGFMALFSINLAVLNLLPIPVLDGGHLALLGIEAVRGRALSLEVRARVMQVGFVIVLGIMFWAVGNDLLRLFGL